MKKTKIQVKKEEYIMNSMKSNCLTTNTGSYLHDLVEICDKIEDDRLFEIVPIRLVAYLEDSLKVNYEFILNQSDYFKKFIQQKEVTIKCDNTKQLLSGKVPLSVQLAYSFKCNSLENIFSNILSLIGVDLKKKGCEKMQPRDWNDIQESLNRLFETRHRLCHESGIGVHISKEIARKWIYDVGVLFSLIYDTIMETIFEDYCIFKKENETINDVGSCLDDIIKKAQKDFVKTEQAIDDIMTLSQTDHRYPGAKPDLNYLGKWKEYRAMRVESENLFPTESKQNMLFALRSKTQYNKALLEEIKIQHRDYINYFASANRKDCKTNNN